MLFRGPQTIAAPLLTTKYCKSINPYGGRDCILFCYKNCDCNDLFSKLRGLLLFAIYFSNLFILLV